MTSQWSPVSKSTILGRNVWILFFRWLVTMDVALSGQWSGMSSFSLIIYSYISIKVFNVNIWLHNGLQFQKVLFWEEMHHFHFLANWWLWMLLSVVSDQVCPVFFNYLFLYFDKSVYCLNLTSQWSPVSKSTILGRNASFSFFS